MYRKRARRILGGFEKSQLVESCRPKKKGDFLLLAKALQQSAHVLAGGGPDVKVSIERWYLSPHVEKPFNSKVIKSFVPELRSRKCFSCFGIPMFYVYMSYESFTYRYEYVYFTYPYLATLHLASLNFLIQYNKNFNTCAWWRAHILLVYKRVVLILGLLIFV